MTAAVLCILLSAAAIVIVGWLDPKRLRNAHDRTSGRSPLDQSARRLLTSVALLPGVVLALMGAWHPFFIWLGAACTLGWLAVLWLNRTAD